MSHSYYELFVVLANVQEFERVKFLIEKEGWLYGAVPELHGAYAVAKHEATNSLEQMRAALETMTAGLIALGFEVHNAAVWLKRADGRRVEL